MQETNINGIRDIHTLKVDFPNASRNEYLNFINSELARNHEWAMELRKKVGIQAMFWPIIIIGTAITSKQIDLSGIGTILQSNAGKISSLLLIATFILLGFFYGLLERRLWERMQYLRRIYVCFVTDQQTDELKRHLTHGCLTEIDYKIFDMRGAYFIQYFLVSIIAVCTSVLIVIMISPK